MRGTLNDHFYSDHSSDETWACDWLSGCFLMVRREAFLEVGHVDESFGKYFEDVDYCLRMAQSGWRVMYHGAAFCYHLEQRSSKKLLSLDACRHLRAYLRWLGKWGLRPSDATIFRETRRVAA
jgi:GT2 family glycosyltransferase